MNPTKKCTRCGKILPATAEYFGVRKDSKCGFRSACRECERARLAKWYEENKEHQRRYMAQYRKENREYLNKLSREYYKNHAEEMREYNRRRYRNGISYPATRKKYYENNKQSMRAKQKQWYAANKDLVNTRQRNRTARKRNASGSYSPSDIRSLLESQKGKCWWCGKALNGEYHVDHRIPLAKGGSNGPDNLCIACPKCNLSKGAKMPWEFNGRLL